MHRNDGPSARRDRTLQVIWAHIEIGTDVDKNRFGTEMHHDICGGAKCECRHDDLIAWANSEGSQRDVEGRRAGIHGNRMITADILSEVGFKTLDLGTGGNPSRAK